MSAASKGMVFNPSQSNSVGVELEVQLLDPKTLGFMNASPEIIRQLNPAYRNRVKEEFIMSMVEVNTRCCGDLKEVEADLSDTINYLRGSAKSCGAELYMSSLHPFETDALPRLSDNPRYKRIMDDLQIVGHRFVTQGLHVHVGVASAERAIAVNNNIRMYLPLLLALSTSSPFYDGKPSGLYSYRSKLFEALPQAGLPDSIDGWQEFQELTALLVEGGIIASVKDLWWDVRPHPDFGTVEVRICDLPARFSHVLALTALIQALVVRLLNVQLHPEVRVQMQILRANKWQAVRHGLEGVFVNPISASRMPIKQAIREMVELVTPVAEELGSLNYLKPIEDILQNGTGAHRQLELYDSSGDFSAMIATMQKEWDS